MLETFQMLSSVAEKDFRERAPWERGEDTERPAELFQDEPFKRKGRYPLNGMSGTIFFKNKIKLRISSNRTKHTALIRASKMTCVSCCHSIMLSSRPSYS